VGTIAGLVEELHYDAGAERWMPHYRLGENVLFTAHVLPAALEATVALDPGERISLLGSRRLSSAMKHIIRNTPMVDGQVLVRVRLNSRAAVGAFSNLVAMKSKLNSGKLRGDK
jgi:hypothetical protein